MNIIKNSLFVLAKEIDSLCVENDIKYYLFGETLKDALVYGDFQNEGVTNFKIAMEYSEWKKFESVFNSSDIENRALDNCVLDHFSTEINARYVDTTTLAIKENQKKDEVLGLGVEIVILDYLAEDESLKDNRIKEQMLYCDLIDPFNAYGLELGINISRYRRKRLKMKFFNRDAVLTDMERRLFKDAEEKKLLIRRKAYPLFIHNISDFQWGRKVVFAGYEFPIPMKSQKILVEEFGDFWQNSTNIDSSVVSFPSDLSESVLSRIDQGAKLKDEETFYKHKYKRAKLFRSRISKLGYERALDETKVRISLDKNRLVTPENLKLLVTGSKYRSIEKLLDVYLDAQSTPLFKGDLGSLEEYKVRPFRLISVDYPIFLSAIYAMMNLGYIDLADKALTEYLQLENEMSKVLTDIHKQVKGLKIVSELIDEDNLDFARKTVMKILELNPNNISALKLLAEILLSLYYRNSKGDEGKLLSVVFEKLEKLSGEDPDLYRFKGDLLYKEDKLSSYEMYSKAYKLAKNSALKNGIKSIIKFDSDEIIEAANMLIEAGFEKKAYKLINLVLGMHEDNEDLLIYKYALLLDSSKGDFLIEDAIKSLEIDVIKYPKYILLQNLLVNSYISMGCSRQEADIKVKFALALKEEDFYSMKEKIELYIEKEPENLIWLYYLANLYKKFGLFKEVWKCYNYATTLIGEEEKNHLRDIYIREIKFFSKLQASNIYTKETKNKILKKWIIIHEPWKDLISSLKNIDLLVDEELKDLRGNAVEYLIENNINPEKLYQICLKHYIDILKKGEKTEKNIDKLKSLVSDFEKEVN